MTLSDAVLEAVRNVRGTFAARGGYLVILRNGEYECIPQAYTTDISWCGRDDDWEWCCEVDNLDDWAIDESISDEDAAEYIVSCL